MPRYHPYRTPTTLVLRPPAPSPQTKQLLKTAKEHLDFYNSAGVLVTWVGDDWELVSRPTRKTASSSIFVGAASFPSVPNFTYPRCPHLDAHGHPYAPMELHISKKLDNVKKDFFRAVDHLCDFIVLIPKVRPAIYTSEDDNETCPSTPSTSLSSSAINEVDDLVNWNPRVPPETGTTPLTSPTSRPTPTPSHKERLLIHYSRYSEAVSAARASSDIDILEACWDGVITGQFETNPSSHLAFPKSGTSTHRVLQPYDQSFYPGCLKRTFLELEFLHTDLGQALRALNSTIGITFDVLQEIIQDSTSCTVCKCRFSRDGFNRHIRDAFCGNSPTRTAGVSPSLTPSSIMLMVARFKSSRSPLSTVYHMNLLCENSRPASSWAQRQSFLIPPLVPPFLNGIPPWESPWTFGRWRRPQPPSARLANFAAPSLRTQLTFTHFQRLLGIYKQHVLSFLPNFSVLLKNKLRAVVQTPTFVSGAMDPPRICLFDTRLAYEQAKQTELTIYSHCLRGAFIGLVSVVVFMAAPCPRTSSWSEATVLFTATITLLVAPTSTLEVLLNDVYRTSTLSHEYSVPIVSSAPYTTPLLASFVLECSKIASPFCPPKLKGYLGDANPEVRQIAKRVMVPGTDLEGRPGPRHVIVPCKTYVDAAAQTDTAMEHNYPTIYAAENEITIMSNLFAKQPLTNKDVLKLIRRCSRCRKIFLSRFLPAHLVVCDTYVDKGA
ncbi:hypothetical protein K438DRAFT_1763907 [Mycena galopus ATCC 62051]|nr:hypothetical protein K438DRAFT_1763907 [Mycena galopus ATCC 62051]